jgi:dienelactone hydrolase
MLIRCFILLVSMLTLRAAESSPAVLPGTKVLEYEGDDLSEWVMDGAHDFVERKIAESRKTRARFWNLDTSSAAAYEKSIQPNRERFKKIIGVVDDRLPPRMERFGDDLRPALILEQTRFQVYQVRWSVVPGFFAEGLLVEPKGKVAANLIAVPDAGQTPEQLLGMVAGHDANGLARLAESGFRIVIPTLVSRAKLETEDRRLKRSDQTYREWIYRQAFHMGRHIIGYEVQEVLAVVDWFTSRYPAEKIGLLGHGEGGLIAFYAAACDPRIQNTIVSGYFGSREKVWAEPIYRNVWGLLREFGDAEILSLIQPRPIRLIYAPYPEVIGHKGEIVMPKFAALSNELARVPKMFDQKSTLVSSAVPGGQAGAVGSPMGVFPVGTIQKFAIDLGHKVEPARESIGKCAVMKNVVVTRHSRVFSGMETHVQNLVRQSEHRRDERFVMKVIPELQDSKWTTLKTYPLQSADKFVAGARAFRQEFHEEGMGRFDEELIAANPRSRKIAETANWTAYDVVLKVYPELIAWGVLVLPKDLKPGEKRPVVVCQHGRNGVPLDTINRNKTAYNDFAAKLAERGFITFAPHNLYRGEDRYRWLDRKANTVKATLFSFIIAQHEQILNWLGTLPNVDPKRIAFYGLSYGGETAVRVPTILEGYCLSICSGDFNQWTRKIAATDQPFSFMSSIEWEMPYWNLGHTFDYAEMAYLMVPRPFMVERGHHDRVGRDQWVAHEYAKVRWLYAQLGMANRTEIEFFQGGHSINGEGTFDFLHKHLKWPKR